MKKIGVILFGLMILSSAQNFFGQSDPRNPLPEWAQRVQEERDRQAETLRKAIEVERSTERTKSVVGINEGLKRAKAEEAEKRKTLEEINEKLSAPAEYYGKYAEFLKAKNTGIARIFPDRDCDKGLVVSVQELERCSNTAQITGAGSLYSIRLSKMPDNLPFDVILGYIGQSDIHFIGDKFVVGNKTIQDIIADVGDVNFADVTLESDSVKFLKNYKPSDSASKLDLQKQILAKGVSANGYSYSSSASVNLNETYVLRSIAYYYVNYKYGYYKNFWNTDLTAAFKVVGQEKDGSVIILWKKLEQKDAPVLRNKK